MTLHQCHNIVSDIKEGGAVHCISCALPRCINPPSRSHLLLDQQLSMHKVLYDFRYLDALKNSVLQVSVFVRVTWKVKVSMPKPQDRQVIAMSLLNLTRHLNLVPEAPSLSLCSKALISLAVVMHASYVAYRKCTVDLKFPSLCLAT